MTTSLLNPTHDSTTTKPSEEPAPAPDIAIERDADQPVLSIRARIGEDEAAPFVATALRDVRAFIEEHHLACAGPPFSICRPVEPGILDIEVGWPLTRPAQGTTRVHSGDLPRSLLRGSPASQPSRHDTACI